MVNIFKNKSWKQKCNTLFYNTTCHHSIVLTNTDLGNVMWLKECYFKLKPTLTQIELISPNSSASIYLFLLLHYFHPMWCRGKESWTCSRWIAYQTWRVQISSGCFCFIDILLSSTGWFQEQIWAWPLKLNGFHYNKSKTRCYRYVPITKKLFIMKEKKRFVNDYVFLLFFIVFS